MTTPRTSLCPVASISPKEAGVDASRGKVGFNYTCTICFKLINSNTFYFHKQTIRYQAEKKSVGRWARR